MEYSVVVTAHNVGAYISETLKSVGLLEESRYEILIFNDKSTDDTSKKIAQFAESKKNVSVINCSYGYPGAVRNEGLKKATGEYIFFLDGDDAFDPNVFSVIDKYLRNSTDMPDIITFDWVLDAFSRNKDNRETICQNDIHTVSSTVWNKVYKSSFLKEHNITFRNDIIYEDMEFTVDCILVANMVHITTIGYYYRVRKDSITHSRMTDFQQKQVIDATENILSKDVNDEIRREYFSKFWWYHMEKLMDAGMKSIVFQNAMTDLVKKYSIKLPDYVCLSTRVARAKFKVIHALLMCEKYKTATLMFKLGVSIRNLI
ncbi:glycosyltransferase family 2 protein [Weissella cibaria]